jgi:phage-related protein
MPAGNWDIDFYYTEEGHYPAKDFIKSLSSTERPRVDRALNRLREHGRDLRRPYVDYLRDGIYELRIRCRNNRYRLLYFIFNRSTFVILDGLLKNEDKVPPVAINRAIDYMNDYLARKAEDR